MATLLKSSKPTNRFNDKTAKLHAYAHSKLLSYVKLQYPKYEIAPHHQLIAAHLEGVEDGTIHRLMIFMPPRHGKRVADIIDVLTPSGWRKHGNLSPGDYVFSPDGNPALITYCSEKRICDVEIEFSNGEVIKTNKDHLWTVYDRSAAKWRTVETRALMKRVWYGEKGKRGGRARWQLPDVKPIQFQRVILPIHPYTLGAWLGDGQSDKMRISYHEDDTEVVEAIAACGYRKTSYSVQWQTNVNYTTFNHGYVRQLKRLNLWKNKHIPEVYLRSNREQREELLAGLIDTDGHVDKKGRVRFSTCSEELRDGVFDLATTLGFRPYIIEVQPTTSSSGIVGKKIVYQVGFQPTRSLPTRIPRKQISGLDIRRRISITDIRLAEKPEMGHCIKVDREDGLYLVGKQLIPTHNTMLVSEYFPAWYLGRNPSREVISATYSFDRSTDIGRKVRNQLTDPVYNEIFPGSTISSDSKSANKFNTEKGGAYFSTGVGGAVTGRGAHLFIIDDPIKGRKDADSEASQQDLRNWFRAVAYTRLMKEHAIILIMTRWSYYDLAGFLIEEAAHEDWKILELPAIAEEDGDVIGRMSGEALWPSRYDGDRLASTRTTIGTREWSSLYQQRPIPEGEGIVNINWLQHFPLHEWQYFMFPNCEALFSLDRLKNKWRRQILDGVLPKLTKVVCSWDTAFKEAQMNDPSAGTVWGIGDNGNYYLLDLINKRMAYPRLKRRVVALHDKWVGYGFGPIPILIEDKASGQSLIQDLKQNHTELSVIPIKADVNKKIRMSETSPLLEAGRVFIPEKASWRVDFETQMAQFPYGKFDDIVDSTSQFLRWSARPQYRRSRRLYWK